jgi:ATP phosphoribosyltransferase
MADDDTLTIALSKGRIFEQAMPLLASAGIRALDDPERSRKLILDTNDPRVKLVIIRASDVPTYVQYGAADLGVAGKDVRLEHGARVCMNRSTCASLAAG